MLVRMLMLGAIVWMGSAEVALAQFAPQIEFRYTCASGRFRVSYSKGKTWHYCFDGKYYNEKTLPPDVRAYFEQVDREHKEAMDKFHQDWDRAEAERAAKGLPTMAEMREQGRQRAAELRARADARNGGVGGGAPILGKATVLKTGGGVEASRRPEAEPVLPAALQAVTPGATAAEVVDALGDPPGKLAPGDGTETWTYVLTSGEFAKVRMQGGKVKEVLLPN